jgi:hypothetical protein
MTAKEKAKELVLFYIEKSTNLGVSTTKKYDKQCALICVDSMLETLWKVGHSFCGEEIYYYEEVKQEINKL